jgi:hypothetical protein
MADRNARQAALLKEQSDAYVRSVASPGYRGADEIAHGKQLLDNGAISQDEFDEIKRRALV